MPLRSSKNVGTPLADILSQKNRYNGNKVSNSIFKENESMFMNEQFESMLGGANDNLAGDFVQNAELPTVNR